MTAWPRARGPLQLMLPLTSELDVRAVLPTIRVPTLVVHHADDPLVPSDRGRYIAEHIPGAKFVQLAGRNVYHFVEPWRESFPGGGDGRS
jgi:pimeloyl-ACP methyl ester carboxylesterase